MTRYAKCPLDRQSDNNQRALYRYLRWRNANARHPGVLTAPRKERARVRSEKGIRWGGRPLIPAATDAANYAVTAPGHIC